MVNIIKQTSIDAVELNKPLNVYYGKVISTNPLKISLNQKITLEKEQVILTKQVKNFKIKVPLKYNYLDNTGNTVNVDTIVETTTLDNHLKLNDTVILLREQQKDSYICIGVL